MIIRLSEGTSLSVRPYPQSMCRRWWESNRRGEEKPLTTHQRGELEHFCRSDGPMWSDVRGSLTKSSPLGRGKADLAS